MKEAIEPLVPNDKVMAVSGYFQSYSGTVVSVHSNGQTATVRFNIFGRENSIDVETRHLQKIEWK